jgi:hypothetical protein
MALLLFDGFEGITSAQFSMRYAQTFGDLVSSVNPVVPHGNAIRLSSGQSNGVDITGTPTTVVVGFRILPRDAAQTITNFIKILQLQDDTNVVHLTIRCEINGAIAVYRGDSTTLLGTSSNTNILQSGTWSYVEVKATINDSTGSVEVKVDGTQELLLTGIDTRNAGNLNITKLRFFGHTGTGAYTYYDDIYVCDTTGSSPYNDFLGDVRVLEIVPDGAGDLTDFTPSSGANYAAVDDATHDSDSTYVESSTSTHTDLYSFANPDSTASTVYAVKVVAVAKKTDVGVQDIQLAAKVGTTTSTSSNISLSDSYDEYEYIMTQNPDTTAAWSISDINSTQAGFKIP